MHEKSMGNLIKYLILQDYLQNNVNGFLQFKFYRKFKIQKIEVNKLKRANSKFTERIFS
jgi:hypothetical protein